MKSSRLVDTLPASFGMSYSGGKISSFGRIALVQWSPVADPYAQWYILLDFSGVIEGAKKRNLMWFSLTMNVLRYSGILSHKRDRIFWTTVDL
jgi:hypothetical protein